MKKYNARLLRTQMGLTFLELLVTLAVISLVMLCLLKTNFFIKKTQTSQQLKVLALTNLNNSIDLAKSSLSSEQKQYELTQLAAQIATQLPYGELVYSDTDITLFWYDKNHPNPSIDCLGKFSTMQCVTAEVKPWYRAAEAETESSAPKQLAMKQSNQVII